MSPRLIAWILAGLAVAALGLIVNDWRLDSKRLPLVEKELSDERATLAQVKADAKIVADASAGYQSELALLRSRNADRPTTPVRLCRATPAPSVRVPSPEPGLDGGTTAPGVVPGRIGEDLEGGPDIGPRLRALADRADQVNAQARGLQTQADGLAPQ